MPIASGGTGIPSVLASPARRKLGRYPFRSPAFSNANTAIVGVTRDSGNNLLGNCTVHLFLTGLDLLVAVTVSDASGNFRFDNPGSGPFYLVAYLAGSPDVAGTTVNTLVAT